MANVKRDQAILKRLAEAAVAYDEALHVAETDVKYKIPKETRRELCNACDDYLAGVQLPRNKPNAPPAQGEPKRAVGARKGARRRK
jgi:hypothetical protein